MSTVFCDIFLKFGKDISGDGEAFETAGNGLYIHNRSIWILGAGAALAGQNPLDYAHYRRDLPCDHLCHSKLHGRALVEKMDTLCLLRHCH